MTELSAARIAAAARRIAPYIVRTPLLESAELNARTGARVLVKAEPLQRTGSFKPRGALSRMTLLSQDELRRGVVAYSSGNHAQAVAWAAKTLGTSAVLVMPADAPAMKIAKTRAWGAEVVLYDRAREDRETIGRRLAEDRGLTLVPPYDDPHVMAGQGTCGLEIAEQARAAGAALDVMLVCCSGGGLAAGVATALRAESPATEVYAIEPAGFDDTARSLASGKRETNAAPAGSICDALLIGTPGALTFEVNRRLLSGGLIVTDDEAMAAMRAAFDMLKIVAEPGGAVALAALLANKIDARGKTVGVVMSGGNVDPALFAQALAQRE